MKKKEHINENSNRLENKSSLESTSSPLHNAVRYCFATIKRALSRRYLDRVLIDTYMYKADLIPNTLTAYVKADHLKWYLETLEKNGIVESSVENSNNKFYRLSEYGYQNMKLFSPLLSIPPE